MTNDRVRTTISLDPEVHEIFKRMAETAGMSVSRCMGEWLADTSDGAQFVAQKMVEARHTPMVVMREMQAMALGITDEVDKTMSAMRQGMRTTPPRSGGSGASPAVAPSSLTGLKSPNKIPKSSLKPPRKAAK